MITILLNLPIDTHIILSIAHFTLMSERRDALLSIDYDDNDEDSIMRYAGRLTDKTLRFFLTEEIADFGNPYNKGMFGQIVEESIFGIRNNSRSEPDFVKTGIELKVTPMKITKKRLVSKERMVLSIINYNEVPERGFRIFSDKNMHILMIFYLWDPDTTMFDYQFLKVVNWIPTEEELRMIREDWEIIEEYVMSGKAHLLSERLTKCLAANRKGAGYDRDLRSQPFSDELANQRSLSFKPQFVTTIFETRPDINKEMKVDISSDMDTVFKDKWLKGESFEDYIMKHFYPFMGKTCAEIESSIGIGIGSNNKQYYHTLALAMLGIRNKKRVKELEGANIELKTVRIKHNGKPKESTPFPAFRYEELVEQTWETSDFHTQLDRTILFIVYSFNSKDTDVDKKDLTFKGAFFWNIPEEDMDVIGKVWEDTRDKIDAGVFDDFVKESDERIAHIRPHAKDKNDTYPFRGMNLTKKSFWFNSNYVKRIIETNLENQDRLDV